MKRYNHTPIKSSSFLLGLGSTSLVLLASLLAPAVTVEAAISSHPSKFDHIHMHEHHHREEKRKNENRRAVEQAIENYRKMVESGEIDHERELEINRRMHHEQFSMDWLDTEHDPKEGFHYYTHPDDYDHEDPFA